MMIYILRNIIVIVQKNCRRLESFLFFRNNNCFIVDESFLV